MLELAEYNYILHHRAGALNQKADLFSRRADHPGVENDNKDIIFLKDENFVRQLEYLPKLYLIEKIIEKKYPIDSSVKNALKENLLNWMQDDEGIIYHNDKIYISNDEELQEEVIHLHHNTPLAGYPGEKRTQELIERNYWWPRMRIQIYEFISTCEICQRQKLSEFVKENYICMV
jgi:hypothetical protein